MSSRPPFISGNACSAALRNSGRSVMRRACQVPPNLASCRNEPKAAKAMSAVVAIATSLQNPSDQKGSLYG
jgi:hypothetical protein